MHYSFNPIKMSIILITIASRLSHALQLQSYNNVHHHRHNVYHIHYSFDPIKMSITSITIAITFSHALQLQSYNNVHHHRHHVYHMHYSFNPITMSITIVITSNTFITALILYHCPSLPSPSPSPLSHALQLQPYNSFHHFQHHRLNVSHMHYSFNLITMSITIAITSITCITASML